MRGFRLRLSLPQTKLLVAREKKLAWVSRVSGEKGKDSPLGRPDTQAKKKTSGAQGNDWMENAQILSMQFQPIPIPMA